MGLIHASLRSVAHSLGTFLRAVVRASFGRWLGGMCTESNPESSGQEETTVHVNCSTTFRTQKRGYWQLAWCLEGSALRHTILLIQPQEGTKSTEQVCLCKVFAESVAEVTGVFLPSRKLGKIGGGDYFKCKDSNAKL